MSNTQVLPIRDLKAPDRVHELLALAYDQDAAEISVDLTRTHSVYPDGAVFLASALSYLQQHRTSPISVRLNPASKLDHIAKPQTLDSFDRRMGHTLTNAVWMYRSEEEAQRLATMFMRALTDRVHCEEGVIDSINWCLYEVMDNVFQHSRADDGFVMMQLHQTQRLCVIAVGDTGIGIQKSLVLSEAASKEILRDPGRAIDHSLKRGVTSKWGQNQGNGLFGLRRAVEINGGELTVRSGFGQWSLRMGEVTSNTNRQIPLIEMENHQSTLVDWRLDCSSKVKIDEALGGRPYSSEILDSIEDEDGVHRVSVREIEDSLGSRKLGADIRTRLVNYLSAGAKFVMLDFRGIGVVSSSFADEVLGKLASEMGELEFRRRIFVEGASATNRSLIETAIHLRLEQDTIESRIPIDDLAERPFPGEGE